MAALSRRYCTNKFMLIPARDTSRLPYWVDTESQSMRRQASLVHTIHYVSIVVGHHNTAVERRPLGRILGDNNVLARSSRRTWISRGAKPAAWDPTQPSDPFGASNQSAFRPTTFAIELSFQKTLVQAFPAEPVPSATSKPTPKIRTFIT